MKLSKITKYALCAALVVMFASCAQNEKTETNAKPATSEKAEASDLMNIRYIDEDSLLSKYNLAKDLSESNLKLSNQYDAAQQQRATEINKFASEVQRKYKNNGYLTGIIIGCLRHNIKCFSVISPVVSCKYFFVLDIDILSH